MHRLNYDKQLVMKVGEITLDVMFCTIATKYRLYQCIALYNSLRKYLPEAILTVLCMDADTNTILSRAGLPGIRLVALEQLESKELRAVKANRSLGEYCWTMKPVLVKHLFDRYKGFEIIAYLDSDLYFFDNPLKLFTGKRSWNVMVTTHKVNRKVNSGFIAFRRTRTSNQVLEWWRKKCLDWCFDRNDKKRFGDQGYLDLMRKMFNGIKYLKMPGVNIAPWNCFNYDFYVRGGRLYIGRSRLIFFHYSRFHLKRIGSSTYSYEAEIPCEICGVYCKELIEVIDYVKSIDSEIAENFYLGI